MNHIELLKEIISIDTSVSHELNPSLNYLKTIDYLEPLFGEVGFETQRVLIPGEHAEGRKGRINLLAHRRNPGKPRLIFYTHIDTVPAQGWDAFTPRVDQEKIYGRGAADMKGAIAALGVVQMDIRVKGRSVHSGVSHLGESAVEKAVPVLNALLDLKKKVTQRRSGVPVHPATGLTVMEPRLNINMIRGGLKVNIVPDECIISVDRRLIPEENVEEAERELLQTLSSVDGVRWEIGDVIKIPTVPPLKDPVVDDLAGILRGERRGARYWG